jgi:membrane protein
MKRRRLAKTSWNLIKTTYREFDKDNAIKLSASLSYFTIFSLPPLLIIIMFISSFFFGKEAVAGRFFIQINQMVGNDAAIQIQQTIKNIELSNNNVFAAVFGGVMLVIGASGVFAEIQSSINFIWGLNAKPNKGIMKFIKNRILSFSMIAVASFLLLVSLMVNTVMDIISTRLMIYFPDITVFLFQILNLIILFVSTTVLFSIIFKTLPDGKIVWKDALIGSGFTSFFFMIGKFAIGFYLGSSTIATVYGAAGSIVVILIWVYYSAIILYFGAEFTKVYAKNHGNKIIPNVYAVEIKKEIFEVKPK